MKPILTRKQLKETLADFPKNLVKSLRGSLPRNAAATADSLVHAGTYSLAASGLMLACSIATGFFDEGLSDGFDASGGIFLALSVMFLAVAVVVKKSDSVRAVLDSRASQRKESYFDEFRFARKFSRRVPYMPGTLPLDELVEDSVKAVRALSLGRTSPVLADYLSLVGKSRNSGDWEACREKVAMLVSEADDLALIWQASFHGMLSIPHLVENGNSNEIAALSEEAGVTAKLDAYYQGIPAADIAGNMKYAGM